MWKIKISKIVFTKADYILFFNNHMSILIIFKSYIHLPINTWTYPTNKQLYRIENTMFLFTKPSPVSFIDLTFLSYNTIYEFRVIGVWISNSNAKEMNNAMQHFEMVKRPVFLCLCSLFYRNVHLCMQADRGRHECVQCVFHSLAYSAHIWRQ